MNRTIVLALLTALATGCAAEFGDNGPVQPDQAEESQGGPIRTFDGKLQRPAEAIGTLAESPTDVESTQIVDFYQKANQADLELGPKYSRSTK